MVCLQSSIEAALLAAQLVAVAGLHHVVKVRCSVLQRVAVCCSMLQCFAALLAAQLVAVAGLHHLSRCIEVCCSVLPCVALYRSVL